MAADPPRQGEGGLHCVSCERADDDYLWTDERWRLMRLPEPSGLPLILILETRHHHDEPGELPDAMAAELGLLIGRVDRAMRVVPTVARVHSCRWGDGSEHLHWWFLARPARLPQLLGSFAAIWDDVLPPTPVGVWDANTAAFLEAFRPPRAAD